MNIEEIYKIENIANLIPNKYKVYFILAIYTVAIVIYSIIIWKFYRFLARRDILNLNLSRYNTTNHPFLKKFFAASLFFIEYILILPFIVSIWFVFFSIFLLLLSQQKDVLQILVISSAMVCATRITSYYNEDLSRDLAKLFPFTLLAVFLIGPSTFNFFEKIKEIPSLLTYILFFIIFIFFVEIFMRIIVLINYIFGDNV